MQKLHLEPFFMHQKLILQTSYTASFARKNGIMPYIHQKFKLWNMLLKNSLDI